MSKTPETQEETFYSKLGIPLTGLTGFRQVIDSNRHTGNVVCAIGEAGIGKTHVVRQAAAERVPIEAFSWHGKLWGTSVPVKTLYLAHMLGEDIHVPYPSKLNYQNLVDLAVKLKDLYTYYERKGTSYAHYTEKFEAQINKISDVLINVDPTAENGVMEYLINKELLDMPKEGILFLDEANRSDKSVIKSVFTLIEDNSIDGREVIPPGVQIVVAINPSDGAYSVNEFEKDHAFRRRLSFIAVTMNTGAWLKYAEGRFNHYVVDFVRALPTYLYDTKIRDAGKIFPCPATWEKVSKLLTTAETTNQDVTNNSIYHSICGHVGVAAGNAIRDYIADKESIINPEEILLQYKPKSDIRSRVLKMVEEARHDVLTELCKGVSLTLLTTQPKPERTAPFLARFMEDLPREVAIDLIANKLNSASEGIDNSAVYISELSIVLNGYEAYTNMFADITKAMENATKEN